jgi:PHD/YefM family antitoxin component YafN of YafNO toxin-antitoxin module
MTNLTNSRSLSDFQRNAKGYIDGLNETKESMLLTVNGKIQAVLVDPIRFQEMEASLERERFMGALSEGLRDIDEGRTKPIEAVYLEMKAKYGF